MRTHLPNELVMQIFEFADSQIFSCTMLQLFFPWICNLISEGLYVNTRDKNNMSPLMLAIELEDQIRNDLSLLQGSSNMKCGKKETTIRIYTVYHLRIVQLIKKIINAPGINLNLRGGNLGRSALFYALNNAKITKVLIDVGIDVNLKDFTDQTALMSSVSTLPLLRFKLDEETEEGKKEASKIVCSISELLKAPGILPNIPCQSDRSVLMIAAACSDLIPFSNDANHPCALKYVSRMLIDAGVDINSQDEYGNTALMIACKRSRNSSNFISLFLEEKFQKKIYVHANKRDFSYQSQTCLMKLLDTNRKEPDTDILDSLNMLLSFPDINVNLQDIYGCTAISYAVKKKKFLSTEILLRHGADVNIRDFRGKSILQKCKCNDLKCLIKPFNKRKRHMCKLCGFPKKNHPKKCRDSKF